jgi:hypothetical protein
MIRNNKGGEKKMIEYLIGAGIIALGIELAQRPSLHNF